MKTMKLESRLYSLAEIVDQKAPIWRFSVPIYQRLYVWGEDQVKTLLEDLINAFERKESLFFLGGVLLVEQPTEPSQTAERVFDLIDGQQRFTTLWLLCHAWGHELEPFLTVPSGESFKPRLNFSIRPEVNNMLEALAIKKLSAPPSDEHGVSRMVDAIACMQRQLTPEKMKELTDFVFRQVKFVVTKVPRETDLNKLFEVINNRGVQLQHHEVLKARMLERLDAAERAQFSVLWDACADMGNYVERSLSAMTNMRAYKVQDLHEEGQLNHGQCVRKALVNHLSADGNHQFLELDDILATEWTDSSATDEQQADKKEGSQEPARVRSIIGFSLLLQHALRIWLFERNLSDLPRILDRELLALFDDHFFKPKETEKSEVENLGAEKARSFIDLLWRLRLLFDQHVIKWVDQGNEEIHLISNISTSTSGGKKYINRSSDTDTHRGFALLQSMLYHSQEITTHYWLTPLLLHLHRHSGNKVEQHFRYLQHLDNHLLCSVPDAHLVVRTRSFMENPWQQRILVHQEELQKDSGVHFAHYWFYKLEFVLWFQKVRSSKEWDKFRLTAKNSVEHISPQTPTPHDTNRAETELHKFGNLALVSRSINSEYGNMPYNEKRQRFLNNNKSQLDSLKMALIYEEDQWNDERTLAHQQQMIDCLNRYMQD